MADPLSIVGLGIGAASFVIQGVHECIKLYKHIVEASEMPESCQYLQLRMRMEQHRFSDIASEVLLLMKDGHNRDHSKGASHINHKLILPIILEIKATFKKIRKNLAKHSNVVDQNKADLSDKAIEQEGATELILQLNSTDDSRSSTTTNESNSMKTVNKRPLSAVRRLWVVVRNPRRLVWVTFDKEDMEALIQKLSDMNSYLVSFVDANRAKRLARIDQAKDMNLLHILRELSDIKAFVNAVGVEARHNTTYRHLLLKKNLRMAAEREKQSDFAKRSYLKTLAELKLRWMEAEQLEDEDMHLIQEEFQPLTLDISDFKTPETGLTFGLHAQRKLCSWRGRDVWVEWTQGCPSDDPFEEKVTDREERIALLARLLCKEKPYGFRVLRCLGYVKSIDVHNNVAFGIAFTLPPHARANPKVTSLRELMKKNGPPPILAKVSLSTALAHSLSNFHSVDWVHKSLNSDNVLFFENEHGAFDVSLPYITGFSISRPSDRDDMTEAPACDPHLDIYRHPNAQFGQAKTVFRKSYDMYSLGVVFTEIAVWKPIEATLGIDDVMRMTRDELRDVYKRLLKLAADEGCTSEMKLGGSDEKQRELTDLASICGTGHREMIRVCLQARNVEKPEYRNEPKDRIHFRMQTMFSEQVEDKLSMMQLALS